VVLTPAARVADVAGQRVARCRAVEPNRGTFAARSRGSAGVGSASRRRRIAENTRAVAMHAAQALDDHVLAGRAVELREIVAIEDVESVENRDSAGRGGGAVTMRTPRYSSTNGCRSISGSSPGVERTRCRPACAHPHELSRKRPLVEAVRTLVRNHAQRAGQFGLLEQLPDVGAAPFRGKCAYRPGCARTRDACARCLAMRSYIGKPLRATGWRVASSA